MAKRWRGTFLLYFDIVHTQLSPIIILSKERRSLVPTLSLSKSHVAVRCDWRPRSDEMAMCRCYAVTLRYYHLTKSSTTSSAAPHLRPFSLKVTRVSRLSWWHHLSPDMRVLWDKSASSRRRPVSSSSTSIMGWTYLWNYCGYKMKTVKVHTWLFNLWRSIIADELD